MPTKELTKNECDALADYLERYDVVPYDGSHSERMLEWATVLESGRYKQTTGGLRGKGNLRCCLGVACDVSRSACGGRWIRLDTYSFKYDDGFDESETSLPSGVRDWLGVFPYDPYILKLKSYGDVGKHHLQFSELNDTYEFSFRMIAWVIRESVRLGKKLSKKLAS